MGKGFFLDRVVSFEGRYDIVSRTTSCRLACFTLPMLYYVISWVAKKREACVYYIENLVILQNADAACGGPSHMEKPTRMCLMDPKKEMRVNTNAKLKEERLRRGWSQQHVADQLGTAVVTVNRWERGTQAPGAYFRLKLCALFGKSEAELGLSNEAGAAALPLASEEPQQAKKDIAGEQKQIKEDEQAKGDVTARQVKVPLTQKKGSSGVIIGLLLLALSILIAGPGLLSPLIMHTLTLANASSPETSRTVAPPTTAFPTTGSSYDKYAAAKGIMFGFDPQHTGFNPYEHQLDSTNVARLTSAWTFPTGSRINSSPVVTNGVVYVGSEDATLYALRASSGELLWLAGGLGSIDSSPAVDAGMVYIGSDNGHLYVFNAAGCGRGQLSCSPLWTADTGQGTESSPVVANGIVYLGSGDGKLYAFNAAGCGGGQRSCSPLWTAPTAGMIHTSPAVAGNHVYVGSSDGKLYAFNAITGKQLWTTTLWTTTTGADNGASPTVARGVVYIGSNNGTLYALDTSTGKHLWMAVTGNYIDTAPAVARGIVYLGSGNHNLYAYSTSGCGQAVCFPLWSAMTGAAIDSSPTVANGVVYIGSADRNLYAFKASGCGQHQCSWLWKGLTGDQVESSPLVANGFVYVGSYDKKLYAFHLSGTPA